MKILSSKAQSGFSLIEVLMVLVIIGVLTTLALMQLGRSRVDFQRQRIAREFKVYLERARFDSVKRRAAGADVAKVILDGPSSFTVILDFDGDGTLLPSETRTINFADRTDAVIQVADTLSYPVTLSFNWRGLVESLDSANQPVTPLFTICSDCSDADPDTTRISISPSGTVAELREGQDPEALPTPTGTNSNAAMPTLNCYVLGANTPSNSCVRR
ncbi:MAG TPA: prepilin-type N-terminal cleavage/methylation domain-containing protein [Pyrinomonadaceae bacterium]